MSFAIFPATQVMMEVMIPVVVPEAVAAAALEVDAH